MAVGLMVFFVACQQKQSEEVLFKYNGKYPDESAENMRIVMSSNGIVSFEAEIPLMNRFYESTEDYLECPKGVKVVSYTENGEMQAVLTANYAKELHNSMYKASGNVVIIDLIKGDTLRTEEITWNQSSRVVFSHALVKQSKADGSVNYGDGFTADDRFSQYTITHPRGVMSGFEF